MMHILSILILRGYLLKFCVPEAVRYCKLFQSSFCEDTYWNISGIDGENQIRVAFNPHFARIPIEILPGLPGYKSGGFLSILILRGYLLKWTHSIRTPESTSIFQSSFCEDTYWNNGLCCWKNIHSYTFNPHFARIPIEIIFSQFWCVDLTQLSILILRGYLLK